MLLRETKHLNKQRDRSCLWIRRFEIVKMSLTHQKANPSNFQPLHILTPSWRVTKCINIFTVCEVAQKRQLLNLV